MNQNKDFFLLDSIFEYSRQLRHVKAQNRLRLLIDQLPNGRKKLHIKGKIFPKKNHNLNLPL